MKIKNHSNFCFFVCTVCFFGRSLCGVGSFSVLNKKEKRKSRIIAIFACFLCVFFFFILFVGLVLLMF